MPYRVAIHPFKVSIPPFEKGGLGGISGVTWQKATCASSLQRFLVQVNLKIK